MVRAAASGAINYAGADPRNRQWRIKHRVLLAEVERREDYELLITAHKHWLALMSHGNLTEDSFRDVKLHANDILGAIQKTVLPWIQAPESADAENAVKKDTIVDTGTKELIDRYKELNDEK
jgi:hypothetical protein